MIEPRSFWPPCLLPKPAQARDVDQIAALQQSARPDCLPMEREEIRRHLDEFEVIHDSESRVIATAVLCFIGVWCGELRSLVVSAEWRGQGLGLGLVERIVGRSRAAQLELVCVTRQRDFFRRLGFHDIDLAQVSPKPRHPGPPDPRRVGMALAAPQLLVGNHGRLSGVLVQESGAAAFT